MAFTTLISAQELATQLSNPDWVILDCQHNLADFSWGKKAYQEAHIPHAQFVDVEAVISGDKHDAEGHFRGRHPLPTKAVFIERLKQFGINNDTQVIIYDVKNSMFASRLWWMLKWVGHENVAVLDGGITFWQSQGLPVTTEIKTPHALGNIQEKTGLVDTVDLAEVKKNLTTQHYLLIDARAPNRFRGENETVDPVAGHIPHAINRFFEDNLQADGRYKTPDQLKQEWSGLISNPATTILQCGSGSSACQNALALDLIGLSGTKLYAGSWSEWCAYPELPIETTQA